jgi:formate hydrogenlyase subunit 6/NADH:ubiquinone oxidoreductase subunit I
MKLGAMINDIIESAFKAPATERYPFEKKAAPERLRGQLLWNRDSCTGCGLCAKDCPANALEVIVIDRKAKQFVIRYNVDQCIYCAQCVHSCRQGCLEMQDTVWELAALDRDDYELLWGDDADVQAVLEGNIPEKPAKKKPAPKRAARPAVESIAAD